MTAFVLFAGATTVHAKWAPGHGPTTRTWLSYGVLYASPQEAAASITLLRGARSDTSIVTGWYAQAQPGLSGGKISGGYGLLSPGETPWMPPVFGMGLKATVLRTWGTPRDLEPGRTLVGPEADLTLAWVKLTAGYLWRVGDGSGERGRFAWGVGVGF